MTAAREKFNRLTERTDRIDDTELDNFWSTLAPPTSSS